MQHVLKDGDFNFDFDFDASDDWFQVGLDLLRLRRLDESINAFESSIREGEKESTSMYNIACAYSLKGDVASGMSWLDKAIEAGFDGDDKMRNDPDIALLRQQSGFDALRRKAKDLSMGGCCENRRGRDDREEWREVMEHHRAMTQKYPNTGRVWMNLGFAALQARDFDTAFAAYQHTLQLGYRVGTSSYNMACGYALRGDRNAAFEWLNKARTAGFELSNYIDSDDDLEALHDDPRWEPLRDDVKAEYRAKHREKDKHKG
jgi:tetratricopeptide (TPR) repeat protein